MPRFMTLVTMLPGTDDRSDTVGALVETLRVLLQSGEINVELKDVHTTLGEIDFVVISEIADAERAAAYAAGVRGALDARVVTLTVLDVDLIDRALGAASETDRPAIGRGLRGDG